MMDELEDCMRQENNLGRVMVAAIALSLFGCSNEVGPPASGSWIEILELEETADALDVESLDAFESVEVLEDRLVFEFDGASPLRVDHVVAGNTTDGYLRRITSLEVQPDGRVVAMTRQAALPEYYRQLHFLFHYRPHRVDQPTVAEPGVATESLGGGCMDTTPCEITGGRSFGTDTAGCTAEYGGTLFAGPFLETDLTASLEFDHGIDIDGPSVWPPSIGSVSFEPDAYFVVDGSLRAGMRLSGTGGAQLTCDADFAALLGGGTAPEVKLAAFAVGPVPVTLSAVPILNGSFSAAADAGEITAEAGAEASAHAEFGVKDGENHVDGPTFEFEPFAEVTTSRAGSLSASGSITAGLQLRLQVGWDFSVGPADVDLGATGTVDLTGTLGVEFTSETAGCAWNVELPWSCEAQLGVELELAANAFGAGFDWSHGHQWDPITLAEGSLGSMSGTLPWCGGGTTTCEPGAPTCTDELLDNDVCAGMMGFRACGANQYERCACTASGWSSCGECMSL
ncbi:Hypothetical protein I5071_11310 [Sandaracinus amylolyticus]|nr:Hypothetical protein I5071_11310 [Sandaracinus amylolyticus]